MVSRILDLTLISAKELKNVSLAGKMDVYAVVSISGTTQKFKTTVGKDGGPNPTWNFPMKFTVEEAAVVNNCLTLVVKIKAAGMFVNRQLGQVQLPIKDLMEGITAEGKPTQVVTLPVIRKWCSGDKPKGDVTFSYKFGGKLISKKATSTPNLSSSSSQPRQQETTSTSCCSNLEKKILVRNKRKIKRGSDFPTAMANCGGSCGGGDGCGGCGGGCCGGCGSGCGGGCGGD
ncbi:hypothetical protein OSB04_009302 [Centaurea solstitialis]|uniref:C2 domain-containing protein n=1 Tax=Centaurea solstitialis TaxID=347529 RepID=A0AA38TCY3_9ASTR|nr:hypothetical protein OSB04_009302 [Centaurea solstitialis]